MPKPHLTYANLVATLALFLALGGGAALAAGKIGAGDIAKGGVHSANLHKRAVTSGKLALGAVRSNQIATSAISSDQIATNSVAPADLQFPVSYLASPSAGSAPVPGGGEAAQYPLVNASWSQHPGGVNVIFGSAVATLAYDPSSGESSCQMVIEVGLRGEVGSAETGGGFQTESTAPEQIESNLGGLPLLDPPATTTRHLSARVRSNGGCSAASTVDSARFRVLDFG